jgi:hypothetical protein
MTEHRITYQASDLAGTKRREFLDAARAGAAQLRDTDGVSLVMVPLKALDTLEQLKTWASRYLQVEGALERRHAERRASDFGDVAWLEIFDEDDQATFRHELHDALLRALATGSTEPVEICVRDWQTTARALSDETRRSILTGRPGEEDFAEVNSPE